VSAGAFFSGKNLQQAVLAAARHFDVDPEQLAYRDRTRTTGIVKSAKAVIEVDPAAFRRIGQQPAAVSRPVPPADRVDRAESPAESVATPVTASAAPPPRAVSPEEALQMARESMTALLRLAGLEAEPDISMSKGGRLRVELSTPGTEVDEDLARSLETLLVRVMRGLSGQAPSCRVDWLDGSRRVREAELESVAGEAARIALAEGREVELPAMDARDRRVVHMALQDRQDVVSESRGEGPGRRLVVGPRRST
jgi:spoIIIJ-associated protein